MRRISGTIFSFLLLAACGGHAVPGPEIESMARAARDAMQTTSSPRYLYALGGGGEVQSFALPMISNEQPSVQTSFSALGVAVESGLLFAGTRSSLAEFNLPLTKAETPTITLNVRNPAGAITASMGFVYVAQNSTVTSYKTPLQRGEALTATIAVSYVRGLASDSSHLYALSARSSNYGSIESFRLPLHNAERPDVAISVKRNDRYGIAVHGDSLYVSEFGNAMVYVYHLPLTKGEVPSKSFATGWFWAGPMAATATDLYVANVSSADAYAGDFALPLRSGEQSVASGSILGDSIGNTLAVQP